MFAIRRSVGWLALVIVALGAVAVLVLPVAAAHLPFPDGQTAAIVMGSGGAAVGPMMPGDIVQSQAIAISAARSSSWAVRPRISGSVALAGALRVQIHSAAGVVLYDGPVADASASGQVGADGAETLDLQVSLPASAGNEIRGAALSLEWVVTTAEGGTSVR